jgi:PRTRC genetic system ThiF family protein
MSLPYVFDYPQQIREVVLVGCGGSGSQAARSLGRIVYDLRRRGHHTPMLKFVDPDIVEPKNVGRQMYLDADCGQFKAEALASRFNLALGLNIVAYAEAFDPDKHCGRYGTLLVGCVDNHLARTALCEPKHAILLDAGNSQSGGQVSLGTTSDPQDIRHCIQRKRFQHLPNIALVFPQLLLPEEPTPIQPATPAPSCAEQVETGEQDLLVNDAMGTILAHYLYRLLNHLPITTFLTVLDASDSFTARSTAITPENLQPYVSG